MSMSKGKIEALISRTMWLNARPRHTKKRHHLQIINQHINPRAGKITSEYRQSLSVLRGMGLSLAPQKLSRLRYK